MCAICEAMGHGVCSSCGNPTWDKGGDGNVQNRFRMPDGSEVCGYCAPFDAVPANVRENREN